MAATWMPAHLSVLFMLKLLTITNSSLSYKYSKKTHSNPTHIAIPSTQEMKPFFTTFAFLLLLVLASFLQVSIAGSAFCDGKCKMRCSKASVQDRCLKYCGLCCEDCNCVPSGTYGNKDECPCYRDMYTGIGKRRRPKCP